MVEKAAVRVESRCCLEESGLSSVYVYVCLFVQHGLVSGNTHARVQATGKRKLQ